MRYFLSHLGALEDARTLAVVDSFPRSLHEACLARRVPCPPVDLGATSLHFEPWRYISPYGAPLPPREHRNSAVQRLYRRISMMGPAEDPAEPAEEDEEDEEPKNLPMEFFAVQSFLAGALFLHEQRP